MTFLREQDIYGHQMQLNYAGKEAFKTSFGGSMTLLTRLFLAIYFIVQFLTVINKDSSNIVSTHNTRNLIKDNFTLTLNESQFSIAVRLVYVANPSGKLPKAVPENIFQYFSIKIS